jgi:HSP20 family protein
MVAKNERTELAPVMYWGPLAMLDEMDRMFRERTIDLDRLWSPPMAGTGHRIPAIDLRETEDAYILEADMPGMAKEDVSIEVGEGILEVTAKKEQASDVEEKGYIRKERGTMLFHRRLELPEDADTDDIKAKLVDGVLQIDIPKMKKVESPKKKVDVE